MSWDLFSSILPILFSRLLFSIFSTSSLPSTPLYPNLNFSPFLHPLNSFLTHQIDPLLHRVEQVVLAEERRGAVPVHGTRGRFHEGAYPHTHTYTHTHTFM
jgi:hypothetical protein